MKRLVPDQSHTGTDRLDHSLLAQPKLALQALTLTCAELFGKLLCLLHNILHDNSHYASIRLDALQSALDETHQFLDQVHMPAAKQGDREFHWQHLLALTHTLDHPQRLHERCEEDEDKAFRAKRAPWLARQRELLLSTIEKLLKLLDQKK